MKAGRSISMHSKVECMRSRYATHSTHTHTSSPYQCKCICLLLGLLDRLELINFSSILSWCTLCCVTICRLSIISQATNRGMKQNQKKINQCMDSFGWHFVSRHQTRHERKCPFWYDLIYQSKWPRCGHQTINGPSYFVCTEYSSQELIFFVCISIWLPTPTAL